MKSIHHRNGSRLRQVFIHSAISGLGGILPLLAGSLSAASLPFEATSSGTWIGDDSGAPIVSLHIEHPSVTAAGFQFDGLIADELADVSGVPFLLHGDFTFTGAGGDLLTGEYSGTAVPTENPGELLGSVLYQFTGGTGLFEGAGGEGTLNAIVQFTGPLEGISTWKWEGTVNVIPEAHHYGLAAGASVGCLALLQWRRRSRQTGGSSNEMRW